MNLIYSILFPLIFWLEIHSHSAASYLIIFMLGWSYWKLIFKKEFEVIIFLILFSRCINGFLVPGNESMFTIGNVLSGYLPVALMILLKISNNKFRLATNLKRSNWLFFYALILVFYGLLDFNLSIYGYKSRLLPIIVLWLYVIFGLESMPLSKLVPVFRVFAVGMLIVYLDPIYLTNRVPMVTEAIVFRESISSVPVSDLIRNWGFFWDARILGIFGYSYFLCAALLKDSWRWFDLLISASIVLTSMSRGGIFVLIIIFAAMYIEWSQTKSQSKLLILVSFGAILPIIIVISVLMLPPEVLELIGIAPGRTDPITQRSGFMSYALEQFFNNPLGSGLGSLKAPGATAGIDVGGTIYDRASDAYWAISLAEIGIFGVIIFVKMMLETVYIKNIYIIALVIGLAVQLVGTDIPDMGLFFFVFMAIWIAAKKHAESKGDIMIMH